MKLKKVREFFWPLLEPYDKPPIATSIIPEEITIEDDSNLRIAFELATQNYESEKTRKNTVESKSIIFISCTGLIITILLAITKDYLFNQNIAHNITTNLFLSMTIVFVIYMSRTLWFSIKCLERQGYHSINKSTYIKVDENYLKNIITDLTNMTFKNNIVINEKVDFMVMAQEYFKRAIITSSLYPLLIVLNTIPVEHFSYEKIMTWVKHSLLTVETSYNFLLFIFLLTIFVNILIAITFILEGYEK